MGFFPLKKHKMSVNRDKLLASKKGFTALEIIIVVGIIGAMALIFYPNIMTSLEKRELENTARDVLSTLQRAKIQAVKTKLNHRIRFVNRASGWFFFIEREDNPTQWNLMHGFVEKIISPKFNVNVNFPNQTVVFSSLGLISNFTSGQNSITIESPKLGSYNQPDQRNIYVFAGGSIQYITSQSD